MSSSSEPLPPVEPLPKRLSLRLRPRAAPLPYELPRPTTIKPRPIITPFTSTASSSSEDSEDSDDSVDITKPFETVEPEEYEVECILQARNRRDGTREYHVKWEGYASKHNSWITRDLFATDDLPAAFEALEKRASRRHVTNPRRVLGRKRTAC